MTWDLVRRIINNAMNLDSVAHSDAYLKIVQATRVGRVVKELKELSSCSSAPFLELELVFQIFLDFFINRN